MNDHHDRLGRGEKGILNTRPARLSIRVPQQVPELDEQTLAFNADSARALARTSVDGDVPNIYANYLKQAGAEGHTTVLDLVEQVNNAQGRDRAERVLHGILGQLPPDQAKAFLGGEVPPQRPIGVRMTDLADDDAVPLFARAALNAFPPMPQPAPRPGPTPTGGEEPDPSPKPQPEPPKPQPQPKPEPEPEPKPEPKPDPEPKPEPEVVDCKELRATLERGRENLREMEDAWEKSVAAYDRAVGAENAAWDGFVGAATQAAAGAGSNCVQGLRQPVKGRGRAGIALTGC